MGLDKYWRHNYGNKASSLSAPSDGTISDTRVMSVKDGAEEWSDGEDSSLDQLEKYLHEQPTRSYSSAAVLSPEPGRIHSIASFSATLLVWRPSRRLYLMPL